MPSGAGHRPTSSRSAARTSRSPPPCAEWDAPSRRGIPRSASPGRACPFPAPTPWRGFAGALEWLWYGLAGGATWVYEFVRAPSWDKLRDALLNSLYPSGSLQRNTGDVFLDAANRSQPYTQQFSAGYQRQLGPSLSVSGDYVHTIARDQWLLENLNPGLRVNTTASGAIIRVDPTFVTNVWQRQNIGAYTYDALNAVLEKRDSHNWSGRVSYTLANSRGNNSGALTATNNYQVLGNANLDLGQGPTDFDRRHNLVLSGRVSEVPHTHGMTLSGTLRMLSGLAMSLIDTNSDPDRNGILADPLPAGSYSGTGPNAITVSNAGGRNGAFGPGYMQLDSRIGWRFKIGAGRTLDLNADVINVTNRANFVNPTADRRSTNFLLLTTLYGGGQPRQAQVGVRFGF